MYKKGIQATDLKLNYFACLFNLQIQKNPNIKLVEGEKKEKSEDLCQADEKPPITRNYGWKILAEISPRNT